MREPEVCFNMDLANAPTGARFCYEAASVLGQTIDATSSAYLDRDVADRDGQVFDEIVQEWTDKLDAAGYYVRWDAGDVVVYDLRAWTDDERDEWFAEMES